MADNPLLALPHADADRARVEEQLRKAVEAPTEAMTEMAGHLLGAGGKRVRPLFAIAAGGCRPGGDEGPAPLDVVRGGVSVELVHLGSLLHDDVIDEAITRRGIDSVNARWGNLRAILAGDFLLAKASEIAASLGTEVAGLLAATIGRLCEGEVIELNDAYNTKRTEDDYRQAIEGKTASLLATACRIGGIVAELHRADIDRLTDFGLAYGMAFQIVDDVLDVIATDDQLGKPAGHDLVEGAYNLPTLRALAGPHGEELRDLLGAPLGGARWERARELVRQGSAVDEAIDEARRYVDRACELVEPFAPYPSAVALAGASRHLLESLDAVRATT
jgi:heptaprenyl diphosphate synthase